MGSLDNILYWQFSLTFQVIIMCMHIISFLVPVALLVFVRDCLVPKPSSNLGKPTMAIVRSILEYPRGQGNYGSCNRKLKASCLSRYSGLEGYRVQSVTILS